MSSPLVRNIVEMPDDQPIARPSAAAGAAEVPAAPLTLLLVRHGRTRYNAEHRIQGWCDSELTPDGWAGVQATAGHLRSTGVSAAYASPSGRTVATAERILEHHPDVALTTHDGLREFSFGDYEAVPEEDLWGHVDAHAMFRQVFEGNFPGLPGGEPGDVYVERVTRAFTQIEQGHGAGDTVLVVSHGVTLMAYLTMVDARPDAPLLNASVTTVHIHADGRREVVSVGVDPSGRALGEPPLPRVDGGSELGV